MTPKERFNQEVWFVLNKIKKYSFYGKDGQDVGYRVYSPPDLSNEGMPFPVEEMKIINKLVEWNAIKIQKPNGRLETAEVSLSNSMKKFIAVVHLKIFEQKFDEIYKRFNEATSQIETSKGSSEFINEIVCVQPKSSGKFTVILNNDYQKTLKGDTDKPSWDLLLKIAKKEPIPYNKEKHKGYIDYFNSNKQNRIYTRTGYKITKIIKIEGKIIVPNVKMNVISEKAFKTRKKRA